MNGLYTSVCRPFLYLQTHPPTTVTYKIQPTISHSRIRGSGIRRNPPAKRRKRVLAFFYERRCGGKYAYPKRIDAGTCCVRKQEPEREHAYSVRHLRRRPRYPPRLGRRTHNRQGRYPQVPCQEVWG